MWPSLKVNREAETARLRRAVTEVETLTELDLVLVLRRESGSYNDVALILAAGCSLAWLCYLVFSSTILDEALWPLDLSLVFVVTWFFASHLPGRRYWPIRSRFRRQVDVAARAAFFDHGVDRTKRRLGVLVYVSALEAEARILGDFHVHLHAGRQHEYERRLGDAWAQTGHSTAVVAGLLTEMGNWMAEDYPRIDETHELHEAVDLGRGDTP